MALLFVSQTKKGVGMHNDIRLGRVFGIEIFISYSWFVIFALVTVTLSFSLFPEQFPRNSVFANIAIGVFSSVLFFISLLLHELSHSLVANLNDIPIKKITLFIFGGMSQMSEEPKDPGAEFKMAIAGPASSLLLAALFFAVYMGLMALGFSSVYYAAFAWLSEVNLILAIFNLAPGFPLDGGRVLRAAVWYMTKNLERATVIASKAGQGVGLLLISFGVLLFLLGQLGGVWLILIGWFLNQSAVASFRQMALHQSLSNVLVEQIMSPEVETISPNLSLEELVNHYFLRFRFGRFPIVEGRSLLGIVTLHDVKEIPRDEWPLKTAGQIIEPIDENMFINPHDEAVNALRKMAENDIGHLLVVDGEKDLVGIVTRADIIQLINVKSELEI